MRPNPRSIDRIAIVDPKLADYQPLFAELEARAARLQMFATGEQALRASGRPMTTLWIINSRLPDMPGVRLWELLRDRFHRSVAFLISDSYSVEDELAARLAGAAAYVCKPVSLAWLQSSLPRCRLPEIRAGPSIVR